MLDGASGHWRNLCPDLTTFYAECKQGAGGRGGGNKLLMCFLFVAKEILSRHMA